MGMGGNGGSLRNCSGVGGRVGFIRAFAFAAIGVEAEEPESGTTRFESETGPHISPSLREQPAGADQAPGSSGAHTKTALVVEMLRRESGATLDELTGATSWLPHTTRAALTGLRKKGHAIDKRKRGAVTCYHLEGQV